MKTKDLKKGKYKASQKKTVFLTGIGGFIASHTVEHIIKNTDWNIIGVDSFRHKGDPLRVTDIETFDPKRITIHHADLSAPLGERLEARIGRPDYIISMASESHVDRSIEYPVPFIQNNVNLVLNMLEFARKVKPEIFIQISTDEVYGPAKPGQLHEEWSTILPSNPYSASKAAQEAIAISYWRTYGVPVVITNTMNNFGERQDPEKFIPMVVKKIGQGEVVPIHGTPGKVGSRFYLHARNHADALIFIIKNLPPKKYGQSGVDRPDRYNVVGEREINNLEMAQLIAKFLGKPLKYKLIDFHSARPGHDLRYALDGLRMRDLGWIPPVPLEESLKKTVQWSIAPENKEWLV